MISLFSKCALSGFVLFSSNVIVMVSWLWIERASSVSFEWFRINLSTPSPSSLKNIGVCTKGFPFGPFSSVGSGPTGVVCSHYF